MVPRSAFARRVQSSHMGEKNDTHMGVTVCHSELGVLFASSGEAHPGRAGPVPRCPETKRSTSHESVVKNREYRCWCFSGDSQRMFSCELQVASASPLRIASAS